MTTSPVEPDPLAPDPIETDPDGTPLESPDPQPLRDDPPLDPIGPGAPH